MPPADTPAAVPGAAGERGTEPLSADPTAFDVRVRFDELMEAMPQYYEQDIWDAQLVAWYLCQEVRAAALRAHPAGERAREREDAERWRAFIGAARIRVLGCAGFAGDRGGYRHIGVELWTQHVAAPEPSNTRAQEMLTEFADVARAAVPPPPVAPCPVCGKSPIEATTTGKLICRSGHRWPAPTGGTAPQLPPTSEVSD